MYRLPIYPIWTDYPVTVQTSEDYVDYTIQLDGGPTIYSGRAFKIPGAASVRIIPNAICAPYVAVTGAPPLSGATPIDGMTRTFILAVSGGSTYTITFSADYSYVTSDKRQYNPLLSPATPMSVTGEVARDQVLAGALYVTDSGATSCRLEAWDGTRELAHWDIAADDTGVMNFTKDLGALTYPSITEMRVKYGTAPTLRYKVVNTCARYILYYVNAFGSWASLIVDGMATETDEYTRTTYKRSYETDYETIRKSIQPRGTVEMQNDYAKKFSLVTGWLSDEQAGRMHHLLGSTNVYLYDRQGSGWDNGPTVGEYIPLVLTASSCEYKTYRNQGGRLVNYTIEAAVAQNYTRR